jgi:hypothetical protein
LALSFSRGPNSEILSRVSQKTGRFVGECYNTGLSCIRQAR